MAKGLIIFLNGESSSGKTVISKEIMRQVEDEYYYLSMDNFQSMIGEKQLRENYWKALNKVGKAMFHTASVFSQLGMNVIIDCVLLDLPELFWYEDVKKLIDDTPLLMVIVSCQLEERERREKDRGDRNIGQSKWQGEHMMQNIIHDLEINTFEKNTQTCVKEILAKIRIS